MGNLKWKGHCYLTTKLGVVASALTRAAQAICGAREDSTWVDAGAVGRCAATDVAEEIAGVVGSKDISVGEHIGCDATADRDLGGATVQSSRAVARR